MTNRILVPLDGSELGTHILPLVRALAKKTRSEVVLLSVIVPLETWSEAVGGIDSDERIAQEAEVARAFLEWVKHELKKDGVVARGRVVFGRAAQSIQDVANEEGARIIAMTTHGRSGLPRLVLGSVADEVVRTSTRPVLLVRASETPATGVGFERILVPVDGSALSESVLPVIEELATTLDAELVLQRVIVPPVVLYPGQVAPSAPPVLDDIEVAVKDSIDVLAEGLRRKGFNVKCEVSFGYPAECILAAAAEYKVDMIAMSSHGRTGVGRWVMGSVADSVVRRADLPCLVIRPPEITKDQPRGGTSGVVEVTPGITVAKTVVPPPALAEHQLDPPRGEQIPPVRPHRPERKGVSKATLFEARGALLLSISVLALAFAACGDDEQTSSPTMTESASTVTDSPLASDDPTATSTSTEEPFKGARDPVEKDAPAVPPTAIQTDTRYAAHSDYDRVTFDFEGNAPGYKIEYVNPPIVADASGNEVQIEGESFLQVRFLGAQAHDEAGNTTIDELEIKPGLSTVVELERTGDFEGQVTWVLGLSEELDFRVIDLTDPTRVAVDIGYP